MASKAEEAAKELIDCVGKTMDVVGMALNDIKTFVKFKVANVDIFLLGLS